MPACEPPLTITDPTSTLTLRVFAAASEPLTSWLQASPSRTMCVSCATASGASKASRQIRLTNCGERFKISTSVSICHSEQALRNNGAFGSLPYLINLRQLRQHRSRLRLDVQALILRRQRHQHAAHAAIRFHRFDHAQRLGAHTRVGIVYQ